jgi:hypothetical protein
MRNIISICLLVCFFGTASRCQTGGEIREIELSKISRGYEEHVRVNPDSIHVLIDNRKDSGSSVSYSRKISPDEWTSLVQTTKNIELKDLPALPSPSMKRAADAAMHATLTVYTKDGKSYSHGYDDEDPHRVLQPLRKAIRDLSNQK